MKLARRHFLHLAAALAVLRSAARSAGAQAYPVRPVRWIIGFPAGGAPDIVARLMAQWLSERLGQPFVIENRPGAGGNIATETVVRAPADGYTLLLMALPPTVTSPMLYHNQNFDVVRDIAPVASISNNPFVMVVNPSVPAATLAEFIAYAKANPGKINVASTGTGNLTYLSAELFKMMAGVDMFEVPSRGEMEAQNDLLTGRSQVMFDPTLSCLGYIKAGKLRALAVTSTTRVDQLPGIPAVAEILPGYDVRGWLGIGAPRGTPTEIIDRLNREVSVGLANDDINRRLVDLGSEQVAMTPAEFGKLVVDETEKWAKVIKFANIKAG